MSSDVTAAARAVQLTPQAQPKRLNFFERYLTLWVAACMAVGVVAGKLLPGAVGALREIEFGQGSQINLPIAVLIWLMIYPMMLKIDFTSILGVRKRPRGVLVTLFVNWLVKPFSMALIGWVFFKHLFLPLIGPALADRPVNHPCLAEPASPGTAPGDFNAQFRMSEDSIVIDHRMAIGCHNLALLR